MHLTAVSRKPYIVGSNVLIKSGGEESTSHGIQCGKKFLSLLTHEDPDSATESFALRGGNLQEKKCQRGTASEN